VRVSVQDGHRLRRLQAPDANELITAPGREQRVVVATRYVRYLGRMAAQRAQQTAVHGAPHLHEVVISALATKRDSFIML